MKTWGHECKDEWSASCSSFFTPRERALDTHLIEWVGPRVGLNAVAKRRNLTLARNLTLNIQSLALIYPSSYRKLFIPNINGWTDVYICTVP
jgi:hypothetical protein